MQKNNVKREKAFLIGVVLKGSSSAQILEQLEEMEFLADTAGADIVSKTTQSRNMPDPATFIGKGKTQTIINQAKELECELIIFNDDISPTQLKNLQKEAGENIKVIDRTGLILDIFTKHAKTKEAKTQVQLAQLEYFLPRLTRQWTHLERQMGGIGTRAGAGETQIEIDRRLIRNQISKLKRELTAIEKQRKVQNHSREEAFRIALVGYTNAGKSTLMNALTDADVLVQNQLFATLDTTTRKLENIDVCIPVLLSDTVGFIRNLPHNLIASFRSTLGEIRDVSVLIGVFSVLKQQLETAKIEEVKKSEYVIILDTPYIPLYPDKPKKKLMVILAGLLGVGMGITLAFIRENANNRNEEEQKKMAKVKSLIIENINLILPRRLTRSFTKY